MERDQAAIDGSERAEKRRASRNWQDPAVSMQLAVEEDLGVSTDLRFREDAEMASTQIFTLPGIKKELRKIVEDPTAPVRERRQALRDLVDILGLAQYRESKDIRSMPQNELHQLLRDFVIPTFRDFAKFTAGTSKPQTGKIHRAVEDGIAKDTVYGTAVGEPKTAEEALWERRRAAAELQAAKKKGFIPTAAQPTPPPPSSDPKNHPDAPPPGKRKRGRPRKYPRPEDLAQNARPPR